MDAKSQVGTSQLKLSIIFLLFYLWLNDAWIYQPGLKRLWCLVCWDEKRRFFSYIELPKLNIGKDMASILE